MAYLKEQLTFGQAGMVLESSGEGNAKSLYMKGIFIQGGVKKRKRACIPHF